MEGSIATSQSVDRAVLVLDCTIVWHGKMDSSMAATPFQCEMYWWLATRRPVERFQDLTTEEVVDMFQCVH